MQNLGIPAKNDGSGMIPASPLQVEAVDLRGDELPRGPSLDKRVKPRSVPGLLMQEQPPEQGCTRLWLGEESKGVKFALLELRVTRSMVSSRGGVFPHHQLARKDQADAAFVGCVLVAVWMGRPVSELDFVVTLQPRVLWVALEHDPHGALAAPAFLACTRASSH